MEKGLRFLERGSRTPRTWRLGVCPGPSGLTPMGPRGWTAAQVPLSAEVLTPGWPCFKQNGRTPSTFLPTEGPRGCVDLFGYFNFSQMCFIYEARRRCAVKRFKGTVALPSGLLASTAAVVFCDSIGSFFFFLTKQDPIVDLASCIFFPQHNSFSHFPSDRH